MLGEVGIEGLTLRGEEGKKCQMGGKLRQGGDL